MSWKWCSEKWSKHFWPKPSHEEFTPKIRADSDLYICQFRSSKCLSSSPEFSISQKPVRATLCPKCHGDPTQFMSIHFPFQMAWKAVRTYCGTHHVSFNYTMQIKRYVYREQARNESPGNGLALSLCPRLFGAASGFWNLDIHWRLTSDCTYDFGFSWTATVIFSDPYTF